MAVTTGTATGRQDLLTKLRAFATANGWSELFWNGSTDLYIAGPGESGNDEIIVQFLQETNVLSIKGYQYVDPRGAYINESHAKGIATWENPMKYWFMITPNRIMGVLKVDAYYASFYGGFLTTAATREQLPYPMFISGSSSGDIVYTSTGSHIGCGCFPEASGQRAPNVYCTAFFDDALNIWNDYEWASYTGPGAVPGAFNDDTTFNRMVLWGNTLNNEVFLTPIHMCNRGYSSAAYGAYATQNSAIIGQMEGVFFLDGTDKIAESIITVNAVDYLLVPNYYRTGRGHFCAFRLN